MRTEPTIVAIGGGRVYAPCKPPETLAIDSEVCRLAKRGNGGRVLNTLFIPTASGDDLGYCNTIYNLYEVRLGCRFEHLRILAERLTDRQIAERIRTADIIYVGGGNTLRMMCAWRKRGVDQLLIQAGERGAVLCGLSAGAICWFRSGLSDSLRSSNDRRSLVAIGGLGIIDSVCCPHYDTDNQYRRSALRNAVAKSRTTGFAIEDNAALVLEFGKFRGIRSRPNRKVRRVWLENHELHEDIISAPTT